MQISAWFGFIESSGISECVFKISDVDSVKYYIMTHAAVKFSPICVSHPKNIMLGMFVNVCELGNEIIFLKRSTIFCML